MSKEKIINILILSNFYNKNDKKDDIHKFLLLEPIIVRIIVNNDKIIDRKELIDSLHKQLDIKNSNSERIVDYFHQLNDSIVIYNRYEKKFSLNPNKDYSEHHNIFEEAEKSFINLQNDLIKQNSIFNKDNIIELIFDFLEKSFTEKNDLDSDFDTLPDIYINIANLLSECYDNKVDNIISTIKYIIKGMALLKAISSDRKENFNKDGKRTIIYLDNIFVTNLFGWCDISYYESSLLVLKTLKEFNFDIRVHEITIELIENYVDKAKKEYKTSNNNIFYNFILHSYFCNNTNAVNVYHCEAENIHNIIIRKLNDLQITISKSISNFLKDEDNTELFNNIYEDRKKNNMRRGGTGEINYEQTLYDMTIIKNFHKIDKTKINDLHNISEIFLTYQKAIINNTLYKSNNIYPPIMNTNTFTNLLLIEKIVCNIQYNNKLIDVFLINSYSNILSKVFNDFINAFKETDLTDEDKEKLLATVYSKEKRNIIVKNDSDPIKVLKYIKSEEEKLKNVCENLAQKESDLNKANENLVQKESDLNKANDKIKELEKYKRQKEREEEHQKKRKMVNRKRRCILIKKIACLITIIIVLLLLYIKFNKHIKLFIDQYIKIPDLITDIASGIIILIISIIPKIIGNYQKNICKKINKYIKSKNLFHIFMM